jgi:hypothetical protein
LILPDENSSSAADTAAKSSIPEHLSSTPAEHLSSTPAEHLSNEAQAEDHERQTTGLAATCSNKMDLMILDGSFLGGKGFYSHTKYEGAVLEGFG